MITLKEYNDIKPGDRVQIVSSWSPGCCENMRGEMDCWLGQVMTVSSHGSYMTMVEDEGIWAWNYRCIEKILGREPIRVCTEDELLGFLGGDA